MTVSAAEVVQALRRASSVEKAEIMKALGQAPAGSTARTAAVVAENVASLREALPVLTEVMATALLADSSLAVWGVTEGEMLETLVPHLDAHWEVLESRLGELALICGRHGVALLQRAEKRVTSARRKRGASEIAQLQGLMALAQERALQEKREEGQEVDQEAVDGEVAAAYQELLADYAAVVGSDGEVPIFGGFTAADLYMLRRCKQWLAKHEPGVFHGGWKELNERLAALFSRSRRTGLDPFTEAELSSIKRVRRSQPHVLFEGLRKGEEAKWGGYLNDVNGRADDGSLVWGGAKDLQTMMNAMEKWRKARNPDGSGENGAYRYLP